MDSVTPKKCVSALASGVVGPQPLVFGCKCMLMQYSPKGSVVSARLEQRRESVSFCSWPFLVYLLLGHYHCTMSPVTTRSADMMLDDITLLLARPLSSSRSRLDGPNSLTSSGAGLPAERKLRNPLRLVHSRDGRRLPTLLIMWGVT